MAMDAAKRSAAVGVVLGLAVAVMGTVIVAIAARLIHVPDAGIHVPRWMLALVGAGIVLCGLAFAFTLLGPRATATIAVPGVALAFVLPVAWIALGRPGRLECSADVSFGFFTLAGLEIGDTACRALLVVATLAGVAIVVALAWLAARRAYTRVKGGSNSPET
jgi:hypothetical protein